MMSYRGATLTQSKHKFNEATIIYIVEITLKSYFHIPLIFYLELIYVLMNLQSFRWESNNILDSTYSLWQNQTIKIM